MCHAAQLPVNISVLVKQEGRCQSWADRSVAVQRPGATEEKQRRFEELKETEKHLILLNLNLSSQEEKDLSEIINDKQASSTMYQFSKRRKQKWTHLIREQSKPRKKS